MNIKEKLRIMRAAATATPSDMEATGDCYRQTRDFALNFLGKFGIENSIVDPTAEAIEAGIKDNTNIIFSSYDSFYLSPIL